jgi:hypothetical protein
MSEKISIFSLPVFDMISWNGLHLKTALCQTALKTFQ